MSELKNEMKENLDTLKDYAKRLEALVHIVTRTIESEKEETTNNSAMHLIVEMKAHPLVEKTKLGTMLSNIHKALHRDAQFKLASKIARDKELLASLNPNQKKKNHS